jgi:hypothetical protein
LRDNQFSHGEAEAAMRHYCSRVPAVNTKGEPESYGEDEMLASLRSAYSGVRRKPWGPSKPHPLGWRENFQRPPTVTTSNGTSEPLPRDQGTPGLLHYLQNDHGNLERIVALHGQDLRYCPPFKKWLVWDGRRWVVDIADEARRLAKKTILEYLRQAISKGQEAPRNSQDSHWTRSGSPMRCAKRKIRPMSCRITWIRTHTCSIF